MEVILFKNFSKRSNSTKRPDDSTGEVRDLVLKANFGFENQNQSTKTSFLTPSFFLSGAEQYTYLKAWGNYYFIDDIRYDINNASYIVCSMDYLATSKDDILNTSAFVRYSSSDYSVQLKDPRIAPLANTNVLQGRAFLSGMVGYTLLLTCAGKDGAVTYGMNIGTFNSIVQELCTYKDNLSDAIRLLFGDVWGAMFRARIIPFANYQYENVTSVNIGAVDFELPFAVTKLTGNNPGYITETVQIPIPSTYDDFRKIDPQFVTMDLFLPFVGTVEISPRDIRNLDSIYVKYVGNVMTGHIIYSIGNRDMSYIVSTYTGEFGVDVPISNVSYANPLAFITGVAEMVGGIATTGAISERTKSGRFRSGAAYNKELATSVRTGGFIGGVGDFLSGFQASAKTIGGFTGNYGEDISKYVILTARVQRSRINPDNLTELYGNPCAAVRKIGDLTGYVQTEGFSLDSNILVSQREEVNTLMDGGVYLE